MKECKSTLEETNSTLGESNRTRDRYFVALHDKEIELAKYKTFKDHTIENDTLERKLKETQEALAQKEHDIKEGLKLKAYEISVVKEKHDELVKQSLLTKSHYEGLVKEKTKIIYDQSDPANRLVPDREEILTLEKESRSKLNKDLVRPYDYTKLNSLYEIFKPASQEYHEQLAHENESLSTNHDIMCSYLHSLSDLDAHTELQCLYLHKVKEYECLAQKISKQTKTVSKEVYNELLRSFAKLEKHLISLELALQQCQEQMKNDRVCKEKASNVFLKEREQYFKIQDLKAQLQDKNIAISELKKLIEKCKGKSVETKFDKPFVVRQPNAQRIPKPSVLGKPTPFSDSLERKSFSKTKSVPKTNVTNVSRPQPKSTQMKDKVVPNNSQVKLKKSKVEDHHRISSISKKTKSVTVCNDSLKFRTLNVNAVCATCGKCMFNSNHDACVSKLLNDVNARTKKPKVVPISIRQPKSQANKSVATPPKKTVASESTIQKSKSYYRILYKKTSKAWKWWIAQQCPSGYKWVPKTKMKWVPKLRKEDVNTSISPTIDNASRITNVLKITNTLRSNLSSVPSSSNSLADCSTHPIHC
ncbi:hypothetical protein Tco_0386163 [Tanacetum coccineum]